MDEAVACRVLTVTIGVMFNASYPSILSCECILLCNMLILYFVNFVYQLRQSIRSLHLPFVSFFYILTSYLLLIREQQKTQRLVTNREKAVDNRLQSMMILPPCSLKRKCPLQITTLPPQILLVSKHWEAVGTWLSRRFSLGQALCVFWVGRVVGGEPGTLKLIVYEKRWQLQIQHSFYFAEILTLSPLFTVKF